MAVYEYVAKSLNGKISRGKVQAQDEKQAWEKVRSIGLFPIKLKEQIGKVRKRPLNCRLLAGFMGELTAMLDSGIPLAQTLNMISGKEPREDLKDVYEKLSRMVLHGMDFSQAMEMSDGIFPPLLIGMMRAGEAEGHLSEATGKMMEYYEKEDATRKKIGTAMVYPAFLLVFVISVMLLLFIEVLPGFFELFKTMDQIPVSTQVVMAVSSGLRSHFFDILAVGISVILITAWILTRPGAACGKDRLLLHFPVTGRLMRMILTGRFARTFGFLYGGGIPFVNALELTADALGNEYLKRRFTRVTEEVKDGMLLSDSLAQIAEFEPELVHAIYIGEESGKLSTMLKQTADSLEIRSETAMKRLLALLEPVMIILMAVIIGYLMLSVMVPIYQYYQSIG